MANKKSLVVGAVTLSVLALLMVAAVQRPAHATAQRQCPSACGVKIEQGPWEYSGDSVIVGVCFKAGTKLFGFEQDGTNGCYTVTGLGTKHVVISGGGSSRECQDISNATFYFDCSGGGGGGIPG